MFAIMFFSCIIAVIHMPDMPDLKLSKQLDPAALSFQSDQFLLAESSVFLCQIAKFLHLMTIFPKG